MRYIWFVLFILLTGSVWAQNSAKVRALEKQRKAALAEKCIILNAHVRKEE